MPIFNEVAKAIQSIFSKDELAKRIYKARTKKVLVLLRPWYLAGCRINRVEGLARAGCTHDLYISAQGLDQRFTKESACALCFGNWAKQLKAFL